MRNEQYARDKEAEGYSLLQQINNDAFHLNNLTRLPMSASIDASGCTNNKAVNIEYKTRNMTLADDKGYNINAISANGNEYRCDSLFIETHKALSLIWEYVNKNNHPSPLYINFLKDDTCLVYNLSRMSPKPDFTEKKWIESKARGVMECGERIKLSTKNAYLYKKDNGKWRLIRKP